MNPDLIERLSALVGELTRRLRRATPTAAAGGAAAPATSGRKRLDNLPNSRIQEIGARYALYITGKIGTSAGRILVLLSYVAVVFMLAHLVGKFFTGLFHIGDPMQYWLLTLAVFSLGVGGGLYQWFIVSVPKLTGLIATNYFIKEQRVYSTGWSIKYPWESYTLNDYIDLQADFAQKLAHGGQSGSTFITSERVPVKFDWTAQFRPYLRLLPVYVSTENRTISQGLEEVIESVIALTITGVAVDDIKNPETLKRLRVNLARALEGEEVGGEASILDEEGNTLEERFGINVELVTFSPPEFAKEYQEAQTASKTFETMARNARDLKRDLGIDGKAAFDRVLVANKEDAKIEVKALEASQGMLDAIKDLGQSIAAAIVGVHSPQPPTPPAGGPPEGLPPTPPGGGPSPVVPPSTP